MWPQRWFVSQEGPDFLVFQTPLPHSLDCTLLNSHRFSFILFNAISFSFPCFSWTLSSISIFLPHFSFILPFLPSLLLLPFQSILSPTPIQSLSLSAWMWSLANLGFIFLLARVCAQLLQLCPTLCDPMDCSPPGSSVQEILQARILEWVAISYSRGSSWPKDPALQADSLPTEPSGKLIFLLETPPVAHNTLCHSPMTVYNQFYEP